MKNVLVVQEKNLSYVTEIYKSKFFKSFKAFNLAFS